MSNTYGFDFLRREHLDAAAQTAAATSTPRDSDRDDDIESPGSPPPPSIDYEAVRHKPDLEKQFDILAFLQAHRGSGCLPPSVIYRNTGIDLDVDTNVASMLQANPKVTTEVLPDPENPALSMISYAYQAKYASVRDRTTLLAQINRMPHGVPCRDLLDSYARVRDDLDALIVAGNVLAVHNSEDKDRVLFPRGEAFLVELDGVVSLPSLSVRGEAGTGNSNTMPPPAPRPPAPEPIAVVDVDVDPRPQIRRGEAVQVGGQWFRLSSAVKEGPLAEQPVRAQAPLSVTSLQDLSKRNEVDGYIRPLSGNLLPLDDFLTVAAQNNVQQARQAREKLVKLSHGRSGGGPASQLLLGSQAHASNPVSLASSLTTSNGHHQRKRPASNSSGAAAAAKAVNGNGNGIVANNVSLQQAAADPALALYTHARRHGCTKDVRAMYLETRTLVPESDAELRAVLLSHQLLNESEQFRRPRLAKNANTDQDGKPKKRRYYERKNQRLTNTHLEGTEIGAILARAAERQRQGESVGDGGM